MSQQELLKKVIQVLNQARIQYMITGSVASSLYGEPQSTNDIDIDVDIHKTDIRKLVNAFPPSEFYLEDTILVKLRWAKLSGGSEKQFIDALRVYEVQYEKLDISYLEHWVEKLGIKELWEKLSAMAQPL